MDGALKKKGISLSMQYLNETPLAQIKENKMKKISIVLSLLIIFACEDKEGISILFSFF